MFHSFSGNSRFRSRSVWITDRPLLKPHRCARRWIWVSTGKAGFSNACDITTEAVLCPTPGSDSNSSKVCGTRLSKRSTRIWDIARMCLDLAGDKPQGFMIARISATDNRAIFWGVSALAKSAGVTLFTILSVDWPESMTATSRVNGSRCFRGIGTSGNNRSRILAIACAFAFLPIDLCFGLPMVPI